MSNEIGNRNTVWIVFEDTRRNYSAGEQFGNLKTVFSSISRNYNPDSAISHAIRTLADMNENDYLLMSGDPALCAICVSLAVEKFGRVRILRWDRVTMTYHPMVLNFE